jgi:hypothetical protein
MRRMLAAYLGEGERTALADGHPRWDVKDWEADPHCYQQAITAVAVSLWEAHADPAAATDPDALDLWLAAIKNRLVNRAVQRAVR